MFTLVDIGNYGSNNDSRIFWHSAKGKAFFDNEMNLPEPESVQENPGLGQLPYFIVGDKASPSSHGY